MTAEYTKYTSVTSVERVSISMDNMAVYHVLDWLNTRLETSSPNILIPIA